MTVEIHTTPLGPGTKIPLTAALDRKVVLDPTLRDAFTAHDVGANNLDRLFRENALCVTSGQQPGLFTGPLFTVYKALSAVAVARACEDALGRPVVPVFWVAGDDHDFAEANHVNLLNQDHRLETIALPPRADDAPSTPLHREVLGPQIDELFERIRAITPDTEFRMEVMDWLTRHYRVGADLASAFGGALAELLGGAGLVVFDPTHPKAKAIAAPLIVKALEGAATLDRDLRSRASELESGGHKAPVAVPAGSTLVMIDGDQGRDRLVTADGGFRTRRYGEQWALDQLREVGNEAPERLSANVLLRPVVEAALLPTVAYIAGPGELEYLPQTAPVYRALGVKPQLAIPRWSALVIEKRVRKVLDRHALTPDDFTLSEGKLEARLVQRDMPTEVETAIDRLRATIEEQFSALVDGAKEIDPTLEKPVEATRSQIAKGIGHVEKRIVSRLKHRNEVLIRQLEHTRNGIHPAGRPQERVLNILHFLIRYGPDFILEAERSCVGWAKTLTP